MGGVRKRPDYEAALRDAGLRITRPRRIILMILRASGDRPDAGQVFRRVRAVDGRVSLATVYRTMKALAEAAAIPGRR